MWAQDTASGPWPSLLQFLEILGMALRLRHLKLHLCPELTVFVNLSMMDLTKVIIATGYVYRCIGSVMTLCTQLQGGVITSS
jgi:hypothetical protein